MSSVQELPRDTVINEIYNAAKKDKDLYFLCCDLGAMALDNFRKELPQQFIHCGISEQNTIDLAAGLALNKKKVFVYAMASFTTIRCLEQIKVTLAAMNLPVTIIGVGVGYGYDDAGPTHYPIDDITCMRSLGNIEIITPADLNSAAEITRMSCEKPAFRYIRLDRKHLPEVYKSNDNRYIQDGIVEIYKGTEACIVTNGYMLQIANEAKKSLAELGINIGIVDAYRLKPIRNEVITKVLSPYKKIITLEEHFLSGGLGSTILESLADACLLRKVKRIGIQDKYRFENGKRAYIQELDKIDPKSVTQSVHNFIKEDRFS